MIKYNIMNETEKEIISSWKYEGIYAIYNMPAYSEQKNKGIALCNPLREKNYFSYYDGNDLIGFTNILEEENEVFIGIGVNPSLCGKGYGKEILVLASKISSKLYPDKPLYLEVRTWNKRAIRCYEKAGFSINGEVIKQTTSIGNGDFYKMKKTEKIPLSCK